MKTAAWALIDRECPLPGCSEQAKVLKDGKIELRGDVAHIVSASDNPKAPRSPASLSPAERDTFRLLIDHREGIENALALCSNCHRKADRDANSFDVRFLFEAQQAVVNRGAKPSGWTPRQLRGLASLSADDFSDDPQRAEALLALIQHNGTADLWQPYADDPEGLASVAASWEVELAHEPWQTVEYLARCATRLGIWGPAQSLWTATALRATQAEASRAAIAEAWILAAGAARRSGDAVAAADLAGRARDLAPDEPVVIASGVTSPMPIEQLQILEPLAHAHERWRAWRHVHRALSFLLAHDLDQAGSELKAIDRRLIPAASIQATVLNYEVERARAVIGKARPFDAWPLQEALNAGHTVLPSLLERHRPGDAVRVRMLMARALLMLDQPEEAVELLDSATDAETHSWEYRGVLAYAYIEAGEQARAIAMIGNRHLSDDAVMRADAIRLRVEAQSLYTVLPEERARELVDELLVLRDEPGWENLTGALALATIAAASNIPWPAEADDLLRDERNTTAVHQLKRAIAASQRNCPDWRAELDDLDSDPAALRTLLVRLSARKAPSTIQADVARALLATDAHARLRNYAAAILLEKVPSAQDGYQAMLGVARDRNAPAALRATSYFDLLRHLRKKRDFREMRRIYDTEVLQLARAGSPAPRRVINVINSWMPTVVRHRKPV